MCGIVVAAAAAAAVVVNFFPCLHIHIRPIQSVLIYVFTSSGDMFVSKLPSAQHRIVSATLSCDAEKKTGNPLAISNKSDDRYAHFHFCAKQYKWKIV